MATGFSQPNALSFFRYFWKMPYPASWNSENGTDCSSGIPIATGTERCQRRFRLFSFGYWMLSAACRYPVLLWHCRIGIQLHFRYSLSSRFLLSYRQHLFLFVECRYSYYTRFRCYFVVNTSNKCLTNV